MQDITIENFAQQLFGPSAPLFDPEYGSSYTYRDGQFELAIAMQKLMIEARSRGKASEDPLQTSGLLEGQTGVGKTLVYAVASLVWYVCTGQRVVVNVSSNKLLDQVVDDLRSACRLLRGIDRRFGAVEVSSLKGRDNYICHRKVAALREQLQKGAVEGLSAEDRADLEATARMFFKEVSAGIGDVFDLGKYSVSLNEQLRSRLTMPSLQCRRERGGFKLRAPNPDYQQEKDEGVKKPRRYLPVTVEPCPYGPKEGAEGEASAPSECGYYLAKQAAQNAGIVVTNTALLSMNNNGLLFGKPGMIVTDEGHQTPEVVRSQKEKVYSLEPFSRAVARMDELIEMYEGETDEAESLRNVASFEAAQFYQAAETLFQRLRMHAEEGGTRSEETKSVERVLYDSALSKRVLRDCMDDVLIRAEQIVALGEVLGERRGDTSAPTHILPYVEELRDALRGGSEQIVWIAHGSDDQRARKPVTKVHRVPADLGKAVNEVIGAPLSAVFSATMSINGDFAFIRESLGMAPGTKAWSVPSPYKYAENLLCYMPPGIPSPKQGGRPAYEVRAEYNRAVQRAARELALVVGGRSLVLFTSRQDLRDCSTVFDGLPFRTLNQARDSTGYINDTFRREETSSLLALRSYGTGFNVPGDALQCAHLWRLPYAPLGAIDEWHMTQLGGGDRDIGFGLYFQQQYLPKMLMELKQWIGRVIRSESDYGVVAIYDPRAQQRNRPGQLVRELLPRGVRITGSLDEVREFIKTHRNRVAANQP